MWRRQGPNNDVCECAGEQGPVGKDEMQRVSVFNTASLLLACPRGTSPFKSDELFFVDYGISHICAPELPALSVRQPQKDDVAEILSKCADLVSDTDLSTPRSSKGRSDLLTKQAATVSGIGMLSRGRTANISRNARKNVLHETPASFTTRAHSAHRRPHTGECTWTLLFSLLMAGDIRPRKGFHHQHHLFFSFFPTAG